MPDSSRTTRDFHLGDILTETVPQRNRRVYGRPRIPRSHRRVMLALLSAADGLTGDRLSRVAMSSRKAAYSVAYGLLTRGWADWEWDPAVPAHTHWRADPRRRFYRLTPAGRKAVMELLGLEEASDG